MDVLQVIGLSVRLHMGKIFAFVLAVIALTTFAVFASRHWWMPTPASQHAHLLDVQFKWGLIDVGIVFLLAQFALAAFAWRFHARQNVKAVSFPQGVRMALTISALFIGIELLSAATLGRRAWAGMYASSASASAITVEAMGQQFAFYFRYPGPDGKFGPVHVNKIDPSVGNYFGLDRASDADSKDDVVSSELVLPVNRPVNLILDSQDVIHSFYVRELRIQQDMVPGMRIPVHFTPTKIGRYEIACMQLCGLGHYRMRAYLQVTSEQDFQKWMQAHR